MNYPGSVWEWLNEPQNLDSEDGWAIVSRMPGLPSGLYSGNFHQRMFD
jgi:hypothetical protein